MSSFNTSSAGRRRTPDRPVLSKSDVADRPFLPERRGGSIGRIISAILAAWLMVAVSACGRSDHERLAIPAADTDAPRIVILPFQNLGQPEDAFLASGLSQEISSRMVALRGLGVVTRRSGAEAGHGLPDVIGIGHALDVDYVLDGKVLWDKTASSDRELVVEARLFDSSNAKLLWSQRQVRPITDLFTIQSRIAHETLQIIGVPLDQEERQVIDAHSTENMEAYGAYLRSFVHRWSFELKEKELEGQFLEQAVALDPQFAVAHAALSEHHSSMFHFRYDRAPQRVASSIAAATRALEIEPNLPEGHRALGYYYYWCQQNFERALSELSLAAEGRPNDPSIISSIGFVLRRQGRWQEALDAFRRAANLTPENDGSALNVASTSGRMRLYSDGAEHCKRAIDLSPGGIFPYIYYARILRTRDGAVVEARDVLEAMPDKDPAQQGFYLYKQAMYERDYQSAMEALESVNPTISEPIDEELFTRSLAECECRILMGTADPAETLDICESARDSLRRSKELSPADPAVHAALGWAHALLGENEQAIEAGERAVELLPITADAMAGHTFLVRLAKIYAWTEEPYLAVKTIQKSLTTPGWLSPATLRLDPDWDPIRDDPRFQELLRIQPATD
jgi:serine/threonine-protein kinase